MSGKDGDRPFWTRGESLMMEIMVRKKISFSPLSAM